MEITEIRLVLKSNDKLRGFANITFDDAFVIRGLKIIDGSKGLFVSMPSKRRTNGSFQDIAHPINSNMRQLIEQKVLEAYNDEINTMDQK